MSFHSSFRKVKSAVSMTETSQLSWVRVEDGWIYATNSRLSAGAPIDWDGEPFTVRGAEFEKALSLVPDGKLTVHEDKIVVSGKMKDSGASKRITIARPSDETLFNFLRPEGNFVTPPLALFDVCSKIQHLMSDDKTKTELCGILLVGDKAYACNNRVAVEHELGAWEIDLDCTIPDFLVAHILGRATDEITGFAVTPQAISMTWDDGSWVRASRFVGDGGAKLLGLFSRFVAPDFAITPEWRSAVFAVKEMSEENIEIHPTKITAGKDAALIEVEIDTPVEETTSWTPKYFEQMLRLATMFAPNQRPNSCWSGDKCRGFIVGRV